MLWIVYVYIVGGWVLALKSLKFGSTHNIAENSMVEIVLKKKNNKKTGRLINFKY